MKLSSQESLALAKMADLMMRADGVIEKQEKAFYLLIMSKLDMTRDEADLFLEKSKSMTPGEAVTILDGMSDQEKMVAASFLGAMCVADGVALETEIVKWHLICSLCNLPKMTVAQACVRMANTVV